MSYEADVMRPWSYHSLKVLGDVSVAVRRSPNGMWSITKSVKGGPVSFVRADEGAFGDMVSRVLEGDESAWVDIATAEFPSLEEQSEVH